MKIRKVLEITAVIIFFSAFVLSLSLPIADPDVFWHLKTGEWIWENKSLPDKDPFSFTVEPAEYETSARTSFILKQYWLAQLLMYGFYNVCGFYGIILFRCLIYLGIGLVLYHWMGRKGISRTGRLVFLIPVVYLSSQWLGERPNNLSFLFSVVVVYLLERMKEDGKAGHFLLLPLTMLLWANMHGGFILGDAIIAIYIFSEISMFYYRKIRHAEVEQSADKSALSGTAGNPAVFNLKPFLMICIISILISLVNPNTYKAVSTLLELKGSYYSVSISEMASPFKYAEMGDYRYVLTIGVISLIFLVRISRLRLRTAALMFFMVLLALTRVRYVPFLIFIATPFLADVWGKFLDDSKIRIERFYRLRIVRYAFFCIPLLVILIFVVFSLFSRMKMTVLENPVISSYYPKATVEFIKKEKPAPEIFNDYAWGGYIIWALYPDYRVFMDGRSLVQSVFFMYNSVLSGSVEDIGGIPSWKAYLRAYKVNTVLIRGSSIIGSGFIRLVRRLAEDNEWYLVFVDKEALLFLRDTEKNREIIARYSKPKVLAYGKALEQAELYRVQHPGDWTAYTTLGEISLYMGNPAVALSYFEAAFRFNPSLRTTSLGILAEKIKTGQDYTKLLDRIFRNPKNGGN